MAANAFQKLLAIFAHPRTVFWRRHLAGPLFKLTAAAPLLFAIADVRLLGWMYIGARVIGTCLSATLVWRELRKHEVLASMRIGTQDMPVRDLLCYSLPLLSNDVAIAVRTSMVTVFLDFFRGIAIVALYRAVVPLARLNLLVSDSFRLLYTPNASRLCAKEDKEGLAALYWGNASWIALFTFPLFIATCCFAQPVVLTLFGERYAESAIVLSLLSLGNYINAVFGFNVVTLRMLGHVRAVVINDILAVLAAVILALTLIPPYGVIGGAIAACTTNVIQNMLSQLALYHAGVLGPIASQYKHDAQASEPTVWLPAALTFVQFVADCVSCPISWRLLATSLTSYDASYGLPVNTSTTRKRVSRLSGCPQHSLSCNS